MKVFTYVWTWLYSYITQVFVNYCIINAEGVPLGDLDIATTKVNKELPSELTAHLFPVLAHFS